MSPESRLETRPVSRDPLCASITLETACIFGFINANRSVEANTELPAAHHHHFFSPLNVFIWAAFRATRQKPGETRKFPPDLRRRAERCSTNERVLIHPGPRARSVPYSARLRSRRPREATILERRYSEERKHRVYPLAVS